MSVADVKVASCALSWLLSKCAAHTDVVDKTSCALQQPETQQTIMLGSAHTDQRVELRSKMRGLKLG